MLDNHPRMLYNKLVILYNFRGVMPSISFFTNQAGNLSAKWPGVTVYVDGKPRKEGQIYLGLVVDKDKGIFWNREHGYCTFDQTTMSFAAAPPEDIPSRWREVDHAKRNPPVCVDFGDSYFLDQFIRGIGYDKVINHLQFGNYDTLYSMVHFYTLESAANCRASGWYRQNYVRFLYPKANLASQRISDLLAAIGTDEQKRRFLVAHISYILENTDGDVCVLIDSTGLPNACNIPYTRVSNHEGDVNIEFRMIALVQKSTGLPLFFELVPGNIVDVSTVMYITKLAQEHGCSIQYMIGDAGYCCPANIEKMILSGMEFMTRINPAYTAYADDINGHLSELDSPSTAVRFRNRLVHVLKIPTIVGKNTDTGEDVSGFIFLCRDMQSKANKDSKLFAKKDISSMTAQQIEEISARFGIFAIVTTRDLTSEELLPEYYIRQKIEQFFDFGKNYAKFLPVREHNMETIAGHMLLSFISSFLICLMNNHLNILDAHYTAVPAKLVMTEKCDDENIYVEKSEDGEKYYYLEQDPISELFKESPNGVFYELRGHKGHVFDNVIIPCPPVRQAKDIYEAFRLASPVSVALREGSEIELEFSKNDRNRLTKKVAFSMKSFLTDEEIEAKKKASKIKKLEKEIQKEGFSLQNTSSEPDTPNAEQQDDNGQAHSSASGPVVKPKRGRPLGSKNKSTLEREAREREEKEKLAHKRGRRLGSKNKKTLEREAAQKKEAQRQARNARRRAKYAENKARKED